MLSWCTEVVMGQGSQPVFPKSTIECVRVCVCVCACVMVEIKPVPAGNHRPKDTRVLYAPL